MQRRWLWRYTALPMWYRNAPSGKLGNFWAASIASGCDFGSQRSEVKVCVVLFSAGHRCASVDLSLPLSLLLSLLLCLLSVWMIVCLYVCLSLSLWLSNIHNGRRQQDVPGTGQSVNCAVCQESEVDPVVVIDVQDWKTFLHQKRAAAVHWTCTRRRVWYF